jgi:flagellar protein FliS
MAYKNALSAYRETKIKTAGQGQLIIMLYDGILKNLDRALELLCLDAQGSNPSGRRTDKKDPADIEQIGKSIIRAQEIITELAVSLDFDNGKDIAKNLFSLYTWFNSELINASITHNAQKITAVRGMIFDLRLTWNEVCTGAGATSGMSHTDESLVVNVAG